MNRKMLLNEMFNTHTRLNILEDILPIITQDLLPYLNEANQNTPSSLEEDDIETKVNESFLSAYKDQLFGYELNRYLSHKHCKPGGFLYQLAFYHTLFNSLEKNGATYVS